MCLLLATKTVRCVKLLLFALEGTWLVVTETSLTTDRFWSDLSVISYQFVKWRTTNIYCENLTAACLEFHNFRSGPFAFLKECMCLGVRNLTSKLTHSMSGTRRIIPITADREMSSEATTGHFQSMSGMALRTVLCYTLSVYFIAQECSI